MKSRQVLFGTIPSAPQTLLSARHWLFLLLLCCAGTRQIAAQGPISPMPNLQFELPFYQGGTTVATQRYTLAGPVGSDRLLPGVRLVRAGASPKYFGVNGNSLKELNTALGTYRDVPEDEVGPTLAREGWVTGVTYDSTNDQVIMVSLGGEGFLHAYSPQANSWSVLTSVNNWDFDSIEYHRHDNTYYGARASHLSSPSTTVPLSISRLARNGEHGTSIIIPDLPFGVGFGAHEAELVSVGEYLVLLLEPGQRFHYMDGVKESRIYLIHPGTGQVTLTYRKVWEQWPPHKNPPVVRMISPEHGAQFDSGSTILLKATAFDAENQPIQLDFIANDLLVGRGNPTVDAAGNLTFHYSWKPADGTYVVKARARDSGGALKDSEPISISVKTLDGEVGAFQLSFYPIQGLSVLNGHVFTRDYNEEGPIGAGRLLPGMRVVQAADGAFYGTHWHRVYKIDGTNGHLQEMTVGSGAEKLSWPMGVAYDSLRNRVLLVSLGGEGFLYAYSVANKQWTTVASMNNRDYDSIVYHRESDLIYAYGHDQNLHKLNAQGQVVGEIDLPHLGLHVGPGGYQTEMVMVGSRIALLVEPDSPFGLQQGHESRLYFIDPNTGAFEQTYRKVWPAPQPNTPPTVRIVHPTDGELFAPGASVLLRAAATDADGTIVSVKFTANGTSLGAATKIHIAGTNFYQLEWQPTSTGSVSLYATALDDQGASTDSQPVGIRVGNPEPTETVVGIVPSDPQATEFSPLADAYDPARFIISRSGDRSSSTTVFFSLHGTARNGEDYQKIPSFATIPAGQGSVEIVIVPISPFETNIVANEKMETVGVRLEPDPTMSPLPSYQIDPLRRNAAAVIYERTPPAAGALEVAIPGAGTTYHDKVEFLVSGYHPTDPIMVVNYSVDGRPVGSSSHEIDWIEGGISAPGYTVHQFVWTNATTGHHVLQARAWIGNELVTSEIPFVVNSVNPSPMVRITHPENGQIFTAGNSVPVQIGVFDPNLSFERVELHAGRGLLRTFLSPTGTNLTFVWVNAPVGQHNLFARATTRSGQVFTSDSVNIVVQSATSASFVERDLPNSYSAGVPFVVTLRATPPAGTLAYAVEDLPPAGWVVSEIAHSGSVDPRTGKVKFGPYTDAQPRSLTYRVWPRTNSTERAEFVGSSSRNGAIYPIRGDQFIEGTSLYHPADRDQNHTITISELTGYAAAWKSGASWHVGPSPIRSDYVTRAGFIWKRGETYRFVAMAPPPHCWAPIEGVLPPLPPVPNITALSVTSTERLAAASILPGTSTQVRLTIAPPSGAAAYTVEEKLPAGWLVSNIDQGGQFDPATGTIRWGLFLDANPRSFSYTVTAPSGVASVAALSGVVSIDGDSREITGSARLVAGSELTDVRLNSTLDSAGRLQLNISSAAGQSGVIEVSTDLQQWTELQPIASPDGSTAIIDDTDTAGELRFYRFRVN